MTTSNHKPQLSDRDRLVFRDLIESRVMTLAQISALHFDGSYEYAKKRLQQLKAAAYVSERKARSNPGRYFASMLSLARGGFAAVADEPFVRHERMSWDDLRGRLDFSEATLAHEIEVIDMKVAFTQAIRAVPSLVLEEFSTHPRRFQFDTEHLERERIFTLKPDAYARVVPRGDGVERAFFFEWDRSSEARRKLGIKAWGYQRYFDSGAFALWNGVPDKRNGVPVEERDRYPLTPIFVLPNAERRNNTAEHLLQLRQPKTGKRLRRDAVLLTTHAEFLANPLGSIYLTLAGYREATAGTVYDPDRHKTTTRVIERDRLVELRARKSALFGRL